MRLSRFFAIFLSGCLLLVALAAVPQVYAQGSGTPVVEGIRYGLNAGKTRIVVDLDRKTDYRVFMLDGPPRLVIDIPRSDWKIPRSRPVAAGDLLKSYRSGDLEGGLTRIVFDLRRTAVVAGAFTLDRSGTARDRVVVDLSPSSQNLFQAGLEKIHGNKLLGGAALGAAPAMPAPESGIAAARNESVARAVPPDMPQRKPPGAAPAPRGGAERKYVIVLDPGHGGADPGAVAGNGVLEKNITLAVARELKRQLEETGRYRVVMTRDRDVQIRLRDRLDLARRERADLFISLHADKIQRTDVRGASIYTLSRTASDAETARLAERENAAGVVAGVDLNSESQEIAGILLDLAMREKMNESSLLARFLEDAFRRKSVRLLPNSHRSAGFAVLKAPDVPSVLIETGFLSNPAEVKLLSSAEFQRRISSAIVDGVDAYFRKIRALQKI
ncbi:MAG: N-acetylmuramoyl-L-alanine amidase [Alphaproteobacteria bacterium]